MYESIDNYYRIQSRIYDITRWAFLFGRKEIYRFLPASENGLQILEIGCGTGFHLSKLHRRYPEAEIIGLDPSESMLKIARKKISNNQITLIKDTYSPSSFPDKSFDLIICSYSLTMIPDIEQTLIAIQKHLKPGAQLLVVDFYKTEFPLFSRWMKKNFVYFDHQVFNRVQDEFSIQNMLSKEVYMGLWSYAIFHGRN